ncbi:MAG: DUF896 domain-containing protein [Epulopiscium sp.]|nr:DUF896 domain-containing protein [Candidatus Epulonipiscium sp.]
MQQQKIDRINELYKKQKKVGLTAEEKEEQSQLRKEYLQLIRGNFHQTLENVYMEDKKGNIVSLNKLRKNKGGQK